MAEFKYALTRVCLRSGTLTLPRKMLDLFPDEGTVEILDTKSNEIHQVEIEGPRTVTGLGPLFAAHEMDVNDELSIRPLDDGTFAVTPVLRVRQPDFDRPEVVARFLDALVEEGRPLTEAEIRALHPSLPADLDLGSLLASEPRLARHEGRWRPADAVSPAAVPSRDPSGPRSAASGPASSNAASGRAVERESVAGAAHAVDPSARESTSATGGDGERGPRGRGAAGGDASRHDAPRDASARHDAARDDAHRHDAAIAAGEDAEANDGAIERSAGRARSSVVEVPAAARSYEHAGLNSEQTPGDLRAVRRTRSALEHVGFRVEALGHGQLMAYADLGRRAYRVLVHTHPEGERLDWASLLARRRDSGATYLAVFGDHRDLVRIHAPAELARATLWSWSGVQRMVDLSRTVLISPVDLESHFERGGLFEHGIERFEQSIAKRIEERGAFSAVLTKLATMRAPAIFLLEDLAVDVELPRDRLVKILDRLGEAPFHLVTRVDSGEFCLRYRVSEALTQLSNYAQSLRERLPDRKRERIVGLGADEEDAVAVSVGRPDASAQAVPLFGGESPEER